MRQRHLVAHALVLGAVLLPGLVPTAAAGRWDIRPATRDSRDSRKPKETRKPDTARPDTTRKGHLPAWEADEPAFRRAPSPEPLAIVGADIHPVTRPVVPGGVLLLRDGRIEAVLPSNGRIPDGYRVVDGRGLRALPGFVAAGADGLGLTDDAFAGGQDAMLARGLGESFDPWSDAVELAASAGITTALVWRSPPQARGPLAGRASILKMSVREPEGALVTDLGGAVAGTDLLGPAGRRAAREALEKARTSEDEASPGSLPELWKALGRGDAPLIATFDRAADILSISELSEELGFRLLLIAPAEAWTLAERLAEADVGVAQNVRYTWGKPRENRRGNMPGGWRHDAVKRLRDAGVPLAILPGTQAITPWGVAGRDLLDLPLEAAFAVRAGLTPTEALEGITIGAARLLGVEKRIGSLEAGKDADIILLDGDPLDYRTFVRVTIVNGHVVHEAAKSRFWHGIIERRDEALRSRSSSP